MEEEIWKPCGEANRTLYEVSNFGRVKGISKYTKKERLLKGNPNQKGYLLVRFGCKYVTIHTLVAYAFIGGRPNGYQIDHINRLKSDNKYDNLRYVSPCENMKNRDDYRHDCLEEDKRRRKTMLQKMRRETKKI